MKPLRWFLLGALAFVAAAVSFFAAVIFGSDEARLANQLVGYALGFCGAAFLFFLGGIVAFVRQDKPSWFSGAPGKVKRDQVC